MLELKRTAEYELRYRIVYDIVIVVILFVICGLNSDDDVVQQHEQY